jgi:hypothetical protein
MKEQCYEDYFYGEDGAIENAFADLEGKFANAIGNLSERSLNGLSDEDIAAVQFFIHYQRARTLAASAALDAFNDLTAKTFLSKHPEFADFPFDKVKIGVEKPQLESLYYATTTSLLVLDLEVKFLVSDKKLGFIVSDHPVIAYNQWAEHHPNLSHYNGTTGLALKGLQFFVPVSPRVCIAMFDPTTYAYGSGKRRTCGIGMHDIRLLNALQACTAHECVYFDPALTPPDELQRILKERASRSGWKTPKMFETAEVPRPDGTTSQLVGFSSPELRIGAKFGFARVTDVGDYEDHHGGSLPVRNRELVEYTEEFHKHIQRQTGRAGEQHADEDDRPANERGSGEKTDAE